MRRLGVAVMGLVLAVPGASSAQLPTAEEAEARCQSWLEALRASPFGDATLRTYDEAPGAGASGVFLSAAADVGEDTALCRAQALVYPAGRVGEESAVERWVFFEEIARDPALRDSDDPPLLGWTRREPMSVETYERLEIGTCQEVDWHGMLRLCDVAWVRGNPMGPGDINVRRSLIVVDQTGFPLGSVELEASTYDDEDGETQVGSVTWELSELGGAGALDVLVTRRLERTNHWLDEGLAAQPHNYAYRDVLRWDGASWARVASVAFAVEVTGDEPMLRAHERGTPTIVPAEAGYQLVVRDVERVEGERLDVRVLEGPVEVPAAVPAAAEARVPRPFDDSGAMVRDQASEQRCRELLTAVLAPGPEGAAAPIAADAATVALVRPGELAFSPLDEGMTPQPVIIDGVEVVRAATGELQCRGNVRLTFGGGVRVQSDRGEVWITEASDGTRLRSAVSVVDRATYFGVD